MYAETRKVSRYYEELFRLPDLPGLHSWALLDLLLQANVMRPRCHE